MAEKNSDILNQRIDKWLFHARFIKSRAKATKLVQAKKLRINGDKIAKASFNIKAGDVLTFEYQMQIRIIKILAINASRRPFKEAQLLYDDQTPIDETEDQNAQDPFDMKVAVRDTGAGRPTKKQRRQLDQFILDHIEF